MNSQMKLYLFVGIGGMIGAVSRYSISLLIHNDYILAWETLIVNFLGAFMLTFILFNNTIKNTMSAQFFTALTVGVFGSFTTFSLVAYETIEIWQTSPVIAIGYTLLNFFGSLGCSSFAFLLSKQRQVKT